MDVTQRWIRSVEVQSREEYDRSGFSLDLSLLLSLFSIIQLDENHINVSRSACAVCWALLGHTERRSLAIGPVSLARLLLDRQLLLCASAGNAARLSAWASCLLHACTNVDLELLWTCMCMRLWRPLAALCFERWATACRHLYFLFFI